jgi:hypothetical protein
MSVHLGKLKAAEGRCQQLQDNLAQQVGMVSCAQHGT